MKMKNKKINGLIIIEKNNNSEIEYKKTTKFVNREKNKITIFSILKNIEIYENQSKVYKESVTNIKSEENSKFKIYKDF